MPSHHPVAFVDTETLGLDPRIHPIWEIAIIVDDEEHLWQVQLHEAQIALADPYALEITDFHSRYNAVTALSFTDTIEKLLLLLSGRHIVGAVPSFDEERIRRMFDIFDTAIGRPNPFMPGGRYPWHYRLWCVESMAHARGYDGGLIQISKDLGIEVDEATVHSALGDARLTKAVYELLRSES